MVIYLAAKWQLPLRQRLDRIGELLAKGVFLYLNKEKKDDSKNENKEKIRNNKTISPDISELEID